MHIKRLTKGSWFNFTEPCKCIKLKFWFEVVYYEVVVIHLETKYIYVHYNRILFRLYLIPVSTQISQLNLKD